MIKNLFLLSTVAAIATCPALAQEAAPEEMSGAGRQIEEIIVSARRTDENRMTVPVAITPISGDAIARAAANNLETISQLAPQIVITRAASGTGGIFSIRGVGSPSNDPGLAQSVTINIDGVQASRGNLVLQGFFDLAQVEVLKGPQALFFGKNSPAGVISLRSISPTDELEGYVKGGYEVEAHQFFGEAAVGGPITDTLKARIAVRASTMQGSLRNVARTPPTPNPNPVMLPFSTPPSTKRNGGEERLGRLTLVYSPSSDFDATLKVSYGKTSDNGASAQGLCNRIGPNAHPIQTNGAISQVDLQADCKLDNTYSAAAIAPELAATIPHARDGQPFAETRASLSSLTMNYHADDITVTSVTGYMNLDFALGSNFAFTSFGTAFGVQTEDTSTISQEIRAVSNFDGPLNFTIGGFYEHASTEVSTALLVNGTLTGGRDPITGNYHGYEVASDGSGNTYSAFGQMRWKIMPQLELASGVRYTRETKKVTSVNKFVHSLLGPILSLRPQGSPLPSSFKDSNWSPEATLSWTPVSGTMVYAAYKTGYKSGGIANSSRLSAAFTRTSQVYNSETSKGQEVGIKTYLADRTIRLELTGYSYLYNNLQVSIFDTITQQTNIQNAAKARVKGAEYAAEWRATPELTVNASAAYNLARYASFPNSICYSGQTVATGCTAARQDLTGRRLPRAPKWNLSAGAEYVGELSDKLNFGLSGSVTYSSSLFTTEVLGPPAANLQKAYTLFNAGARLFQEDTGFSLELIGRNLANKFYTKSCGSRGGLNEYWCVNERGRQIVLQGSYRF